MKKIITTAILISVLAVFAQAKFGMQMRLRSELQNLNSTDADKQFYGRMVDVRFRPNIDYTLNDYLSVKSVFEIGDIGFGTDESSYAGYDGAMGTDGINFKTKNVFIEVKPTRNHTIQLGLVPYKDPHSIIIDDDVAGILWKGNFEKYNASFGWFAARDEGERYNAADKNTYSFGATLFTIDQEYQLNKSISFGLHNSFIFDRTEIMSGVNYDYASIYLAPRFVGSFMDKFFVDAQFINNYRIYDYDNVGDNPAFAGREELPKNGLGLSVKSKFIMDSKTTFRANLLFRGCYEGWENYEAYRSLYDTGLEILNDDANGIYTHNPMNSFIFSRARGDEQLGIVLPSVFVDWKYKENMVFTGGFGFILNDQAYGKKIDIDNVLESKNTDMFIAWELDLKAKIVLYESITFLPYMAFMMPSDNFVYNSANNSENFDENGEPATDMQMKIGTTVMYNF
jgi:hypothetical protein